MKRIISAFIVVLLTIALVGCTITTEDTPAATSSNRLTGYASRVDFIDGWSISGCSFEYLNDYTVKLIRTEDSQVFYVPLSSIDMMWIN